jgi:hypothetical protein
MEGFTLLGIRTRRFLLLLSPLMPGGYQSGMTKSKDCRFCVGKEIRGIFKNSPQCFSQCFSRFSQCPHIVYKIVGHNHAFPLSFVNCGLKLLRLLLVHVVIYVSVIHINLGSALLCTTNDHQIINWWKKWIDFVKSKFHLSENIQWYFMQIELNSNSTIGLRFNWIEFKFHWRKIRWCKLMKKVLKISFWIWCWKIII